MTKRISELPAAGSVADTDEVELNQSGVSRKATRGQIVAGLAGAAHAHDLIDITDAGALAALDTVGTAEIAASAYASQSDAVAGADSTKLMSALRTAEAIAARAAAPEHDHALADITDAGALAALNVVGVAEIAAGAFASQSEAVAGTDNNKIMTALRTAEAIAAQVLGTVSAEEVQDIVGAMFSGNTETRIAATYDDPNGKIDLVVDDDLANYDNTNTAFITAAGATFAGAIILGAGGAISDNGPISASGALTKATHGGRVVLTTGNVTIPNASDDVGMGGIIKAGGAHTVSFNSTSLTLATDDLLTYYVQSPTVLIRSKRVAADQPEMAAEEPVQDAGLFVAYYAGYDANNMPASEIPWSLGITHLMHFAAAPVSDSSVNMDQFSPGLDPAAVLASRSAASSTAKVLLVMGGASSDAAFQAAIANDQALLVDNIVAAVVANGYEGVDIDWEGHGVAEADAVQFDTFMRALQADLVAADADYILTTSSTGRPAPSHLTYWLPMMKGLCDEGIIEFAYAQLIQMAQPTFSSGSVWHHEPIYHDQSDFGTPGFQIGVDEAIDSYMAEGFDPATLVVGSTLSGRPWTDGIMDISPGSGGCFEPCQKWDTGGEPLGRPSLGSEILYRDILNLVPEPLTVDLSASRRGCGGVITWSDAAANASQPHLTGTPGTGTSAAPSAPSITTTVDNCTAVAAISIVGSHDLSGLTPPEGWTQIGEFRSHTTTANSNGSYVTLAIAYKTMPTASATGDATWTNGVSREWTGVQIALAPDASTPPSINGAESLTSHTSPDDPQIVPLGSQTYTSGDYALGIYAVSGSGNTVSGMASGDDSYSEIVQATNTNLGLGLFEGTISGDFGGPTTYRRDVLSGNTPFLSNPTSTLFLSFDDEVSLADKAEYVVDTRGLRGVGVWAVNWDYNAAGSTDAEKHPLIAAINAVLVSL